MEPNKELKEQLKAVESIGTVENGVLAGEPDFYYYLKAFEGKRVRWRLELAAADSLES